MISRPGDNVRKLLVILLFSLAIGGVATTIAANEVTVTGSTTVGPLGILCADSFNAVQTDYHVSVSQTGTGAGVTSIAEGKADVAMASREITPDEKAKYGDKFQETLVGYDGIAICVSKTIYDAGVTALTREQVRKIYQGQIKNWKDVGGPNEAIYVISREQGSGTRDTFLEDIFGSNKAETPGVSTYSSSNSEIKTAITGSDKAIGYLGYSYAQGGNLKPLKLDGVLLTPETAKDRTYPLARRLYLDTFGDPKPGARAFMEFVKGPQGQKIAEDNGFITLNAPSIQTAAQANLTSERVEKNESAEKKTQPGFELAFGLIGLLVVSYVSRKRHA
jgi:phosphate transport system substrate-binding protein